MAHVSGNEVENIFNCKKDFITEKEMCAYIETNMDLFCKDVLGDVYVRHEREHRFIGSRPMKGISSARVDFMIHCENGAYAVEIKNPHQRYAELAKAIGQVLVYEYELSSRNSNVQIVLVSSSHSDFICQIISKYNLPIRYIVLNREHTAEYVRKTA